MATSPFLWGSGGAKLTPEEIALQRSVLARRKAQGVDVSPIASPLQGLARVVDALGDRYQESQLNASAADNAKVNQDILTSLLGGGSTASSMPTNGVAKELSATSPVATSPTVNIGASQEEFISSLLPAAIEESKRTGVDPRIIVGQAALESGWGKSAPGNNYFGIKSHGQAGGNQLATTEVINGKPVRITDSFRAYQSPAESVRGYGDFILQNPRYEGLRTAQGLDGQLEALQASGYATDPNYGNKVGAIARAIQLPSDGDLSALPVRNVGQAPVVASPQVAQSQNIAPTNALGVSPAIIQALTSPYANEQTQGVAKLLMQRQQSQAEQQQKLALAEQQRQQEIARRQAIAQQAGIDPAYAADDDIWKAAAGNIFAAPSTSTVGANVIDNRTGKPIYQGTPESPTSVQEYEYAKGQGYEGSYAQYQSDMKRASANNTTINTGEGNKFFNVLDENNAKTFSGLSDTGMQARSNLAQVDQLGKLLETTPTGATAALKQAAGEYGINTEGLSDIQAATALINKLVPAQRQPGSGSMSDQDLALFKQSLPRLINQPGSNATIVNTLKAISQYQIAQGDIADRVADREMTPAEARKAIADLPNPLAGFKPPAAGKEGDGWKQIAPNIRIKPLGN